ncbi:hypothetical protein [Nostoc sp.]
MEVFADKLNLSALEMANNAGKILIYDKSIDLVYFMIARILP